MVEPRRVPGQYSSHSHHAQPEIDQNLREAAARVQALFSTLSDLAFVVKKGGIIAELHAPKDNEFLLSPDYVVGKKVMELLPLSVGQQVMYHLEKTLRTGQSATFTCPFEVLGKAREFQIRAAASSTDEVIALVRDITDRRRLEKEVLEISNREQCRIGQDLHDGLGQHLTGITFLTRALEGKLSAKGLPEAAEAAEIGKLVIQALTQTRSLARGLFPVELESKGLAHALRELAANIETTFGINCQFEGDEQITIQSQAISSHLFRLAQEAVNNSVKHGKAKNVWISLQQSEDRTMLSVRDDGIGLPKEKPQSNGLGLRIMSYRAQKIGGVFEIQGGENSGTLVTCRFRNAAGTGDTKFLPRTC
jgi:two-component system, LuxR family, sensor kinase FixL